MLAPPPTMIYSIPDQDSTKSHLELVSSSLPSWEHEHTTNSTLLTGTWRFPWDSGGPGNDSFHMQSSPSWMETASCDVCSELESLEGRHLWVWFIICVIEYVPKPIHDVGMNSNVRDGFGYLGDTDMSVRGDWLSVSQSGSGHWWGGCECGARWCIRTLHTSIQFLWDSKSVSESKAKFRAPWLFWASAERPAPFREHPLGTV